MINKLVTVGVPTYNRPEQLTNCLNKLIQQTYPYIEILVSDNHSTNYDAKALLNDFVNKDSRVKYIIQDENIGGENNFNFVFNQAKSDYYIWLSDDDYFDNDYIEKCVTFLEENPEYVSCAGLTKFTSNDIVKFVEKGFSLENNTGIIRVINYFYHVGKNGIFYGVIRRNKLSENPVGDYLASDWCLVATLAFQGKIKTIKSTSIFRSLDGGSINRKSMVKRWKLNWFQALFFETFGAYTISKNLFKDSKVANYKNGFIRFVIQLGVFIFLNIKYLTTSIKRRLIKT